MAECENTSAIHVLHFFISVPALKELLDYNNQCAVTGESEVLDASADMMAFGALRYEETFLRNSCCIHRKPNMT